MYTIDYYSNNVSTMYKEDYTPGIIFFINNRLYKVYHS